MNRSNGLLRSLLAAAVLMLGACATPPQPLYHWGGYETQLYRMFSEPGAALPQQQLAELEAQVQLARAGNRSLPPGYHAHLGYLYYQAGKEDQALQALETEKALYPESAMYMERLMDRLAPGRKSSSAAAAPVTGASGIADRTANAKALPSTNASKAATRAEPAPSNGPASRSMSGKAIPQRTPGQ